MSSSLPASTLTRLLAVRYLYASSLVCILWDTVITLDREVQLIWSKGLNATNVIFVLNRHGVTLVQIVFQYTTSGIPGGLNLQRCKVIVPFMLSCTLVSSALTNGYMAFYYVTLWERNKRVRTALTAMYLVTYIPASILCIWSVIDSHHLIRYAPKVNECFTTEQPSMMKGFWGLLVWFDLCAFIIVVLNTLDRPHRRTIDAIKRLRQDGFAWFGTLFVLRLVNLVCIVRLPVRQLTTMRAVTEGVLHPGDAFLHLFYIWAVICILLSRFIFRVEQARQPRSNVYLWNASAETFQLRGVGDR